MEMFFLAVECDSSNSMVTELEAGNHIAIVSALPADARSIVG
jgi:hypothetical protein